MHSKQSINLCQRMQGHKFLLQTFRNGKWEWGESGLQSRPIKMRAPILYLANRWMDSKMLLTPNRFSYLVILLLVAFHWIPQFIAQFCSICPFVCPPLPLRLNCINLRDRAEAAAAHLCPCCHFSLLSPFEETKWRSKKVIKPWILIENGTFEGFSLKSKLFLYRNKTFWFIKLCSMSKDGRDSATLILMKISHFDRTAL